MPGLVRKLLIFAAVDGLILQPAPPRNHKPATDQAIKISYKGGRGNAILPLLEGPSRGGYGKGHIGSTWNCRYENMRILLILLRLSKTRRRFA